MLVKKWRHKLKKNKFITNKRINNIFTNKTKKSLQIKIITKPKDMQT